MTICLPSSEEASLYLSLQSQTPFSVMGPPGQIQSPVEALWAHTVAGPAFVPGNRIHYESELPPLTGHSQPVLPERLTSGSQPHGS